MSINAVVRRAPIPAFLLAAIVAGHGAWLVSHVRPAVWTPDAHSYYRQARLVADTGRPSFVRESPAQFVGPHRGEGADGRCYSTHPPGFSILLAGGLRRPNRRAASAAAAGAAVSLTPLLIRNQAAWGAFGKTGYDLVNDGPGLMLPLCVAGVWVWARRGGTRSRAWLTAGLIVPITLVYMSFYRPPDGQSMRFFLPSFPLYAIGTACVARGLAGSVPAVGVRRGRRVRCAHGPVGAAPLGAHAGRRPVHTSRTGTGSAATAIGETAGQPDFRSDARRPTARAAEVDPDVTRPVRELEDRG